MNFKRPESVLVVVISASQEVLILQRSDKTDFWQSVTGSMEWKEQHPIDSAWRELLEETGLTFRDGQMHDCACQWWFDIFPYWQHRYENGVKKNLEHVFCFKMTKAKKIKVSQEHLIYRWVSKEEAIKKVTSPSNQRAIRDFV